MSHVYQEVCNKKKGSSLSVPRRRPRRWYIRIPSIGIPTVSIPIVIVAIPLIHGRTRRRSTRRAPTRYLGSITAHNRCRAILGHETPCPGHAAAVDEREENDEDNEAAHASGKADNEGFMVADPAPNRRTLALAAVAFAAGVTRRAIQEILECINTFAEGITHETLGRATDDSAGRCAYDI